jgi:PAS domain S-box-containing protein
MTLYRNLSIKSKLAAITLTACVAALGLAFAALFVHEVRSFRETLVRDLKGQATTLAGLSTAALTFDDKATATEMLGELKNQGHIKWAVIFKDERPFAVFRSAAHRAEVPDRPPAGYGQEFAPDGLKLHSEIQLKGEKVGTLYLGADTSQLRERLWEYGQILLVVFVASSLGAYFLASRLQRSIVVPVRRLDDAARLIAEWQDYSVRVPEGGADELGRLTAAFNQMVTRIQKQDTELRESRERFEIAVAGARDGIWDWNLNTGEIFFSHQWKAMLGYADDEIAPTREAWLGLFVHTAERNETVRVLEEYLNGLRPTFEVEFRLRHKDGSHRWILSRGAALWNSDGTASRMAGSNTDITERKNAESQLIVARKKFESLVNSIHGIVWEAEALDASVVFINDQVERILGHSARRWFDEPGFWTKIIHPDDRPAALRALRRSIGRGQSFQLEHRALAADGRMLWLSQSVSIEKRRGRSVLLRGVAIDITGQKQAAAKIEQMQRELVDASRLAGMAEVATSVLHNVGNVLNSVNLSAGIVVDQLQSSKLASLRRVVGLLQEHKGRLGDFLAHDPKGQRLPAFIEAIAEELTREQERLIREAEGLRKNVEHIKQIVAMQQSYGRVSGALENLSLAELVDDALQMSVDSLQRHQIAVAREFEDVPPILADRHVMLQILVNLVSNARQALNARAEGRRLVVRIARRGPDRVAIEVADNGAGIAPENLVRIFNFGFTTKKDGHGFGLHSGANAARKMGGSLEVRSPGVGQGATFILELPVRTASPGAGKTRLAA